MNYHRWRSYPQNGSELYHYGVIGMRWGVHKVRKATRAGDAVAKKAAQDEIVTKATKKLKKIDRRYERHQNIADRRAARAERRTHRLLFKNKRGAARSLRWAARRQYWADKQAYKGKKWYQHLSNAYKDAGIPIDEETRRIGEKLIGVVRWQTRSHYS